MTSTRREALTAGATGVAPLFAGRPGPPADTAVSATLTSVKGVRLASGARQARVRLKPDETVVARVRVARGGRRIASRKLILGAGSHTLRLAIGRTVAAGGAQVTIRLTDGAHNARTYTRAIHVPKAKAA
jgi:hypothetical protein